MDASSLVHGISGTSRVVRAHKTSIVLNNAAVQWLLRGFYREAIQSLHDALQLHTRGDDVAEEVISDLLDQSRRSMQTCSAASSQATNRVPSGRFHDISSLSNPNQVHRILTKPKDCDAVKVAFPMTIDLIDLEPCTIGTMRFEACIMAFNYGLALEYQADSVATSHITTDPVDVWFQQHHVVMVHQNQAYHTCCLARDMLMQATTEQWDDRYLLLRTVLTHSLLNIAIKLNVQSDCDLCCNDMVVLLTAVEAQDSYLPPIDPTVAMAA